MPQPTSFFVSHDNQQLFENLNVNTCSVLYAADYTYMCSQNHHLLCKYVVEYYVFSVAHILDKPSYHNYVLSFYISRYTSSPFDAALTQRLTSKVKNYFGSKRAQCKCTEFSVIKFK